LSISWKIALSGLIGAAVMLTGRGSAKKITAYYRRTLGAISKVCPVFIVDDVQKLPFEKVLKKEVQLAAQMNDFLDFLICFSGKHFSLAGFHGTKNPC
jgi:hypothetical protein